MFRDTIKVQLSIWLIILWKHKWENAHRRGDHIVGTVNIKPEMLEMQTSIEV